MVDAAALVGPRITFLEAGREVTETVYGAEFDVLIEGVAGGAEVDVAATLPGYRSVATFLADEAGVIRLSRDAPISGSYAGVDPDGLIWSMRRESEEVADTLDITFVVSQLEVEAARRVLRRRPMGADATRVDVREDGLVGTLYAPAASEPQPAILVLGGSEGGVPEFTAAYFESLGYVTFGLAYFGDASLPPELRNIPVEYVDQALDWLGRRPEVDSAHLGVAGSSRGGELALIVASRNPDVDAVVAMVPSGLVMGTADGDDSAWTTGGAPVTALPFPADATWTRETLPDGTVAYRGTPAIERALDLASAESIDAATIPVERATGSVLLLGAEDDGVWPSCRLAEFAWARLSSSGHAGARGDQFVCQRDAGHLFGIPGWPTEEFYALPTVAMWLVMGGTPEGNGRGARESDRLIRSFLQRHLR